MYLTSNKNWQAAAQRCWLRRDSRTLRHTVPWFLLGVRAIFLPTLAGNGGHFFQICSRIINVRNGEKSSGVKTCDVSEEKVTAQGGRRLRGDREFRDNENKPNRSYRLCIVLSSTVIGNKEITPGINTVWIFKRHLSLFLFRLIFPPPAQNDLQ